MAGTTKGGKQRNESTTIRISHCIVCGNEVTNRKSRQHSRGGRYCKIHGNDQSVLMVITYQNKHKQNIAA